MPAPIFDASDVFVSGADAGLTTTFPVGHQAHNDGDLVIQHLSLDDNITITGPGTGPNGETLLADSGGHVGAPAIHQIAWVASAVTPQGTQNWSGNAVVSPWEATSTVIPAGEFDPLNPIDSISGVNGSASNATTVPTPAWLGVAAGGRVIVFMGVDRDTISGPANGWVLPFVGDGVPSNANIINHLAYRTAETGLGESIATINFPLPGNDTSTSIGLVVNGPPAASDEQEQSGYRFYDDGTEAGAAPRAAENANIAADIGEQVQIRIQLNNTGDYGPEQIQLEESIQGADTWSPVT